MGRGQVVDVVIHLDTHVVVWLYAGEHHRIPSGLVARFETERLAVSPIVRLELAYLKEIDRITHDPARIIDELRRALSLMIDGTPFDDVIAEAESDGLRFTRDPFDRIIGGQARAAGAELATKDEKLRAHLDLAVWE